MPDSSIVGSSPSPAATQGLWTNVGSRTPAHYFFSETNSS